MNKWILVGVGLIATTTLCSANSCTDQQDSYHYYDNKVTIRDINMVSSDYYILSYSWSPNHCAKASNKSKRAGAKNYLQCHQSNKFGYILHGLWPQGRINGKAGYPRACEGDQPKIARKVLEPFLCMTPSVWLLQHEYEFHGTCMPSSSLKTPLGYLSMAKELHNQLTLPTVELDYNDRATNWWYKNNQQLMAGSVQYWAKGQEWQLCYDKNFESFTCPSNRNHKQFKSNSSSAKKSEETSKKTKEAAKAGRNKQSADKTVCKIKGNISKKTNKKLYFEPQHPQYRGVKINTQQGERCFDSKREAEQSGWRKAQ